MRTRITSAVLFTAAVLSLSACSDDDKTEAGSAPTAAATTAAATAPAADPAADKALCEEVNKAGESMKKAIITLASSQTDGEIPPAEAKAIFEDFSKQLNKAVECAGASAVGTQAKAVAGEAAKIAAAADPIAASDSTDFEKLGGEFTKTCKTVGAKINF